MIYDFNEIEYGYDIETDFVVIGSGAGGAIAAYNLAHAGFETVILEAGPQVRFSEMTRNAPKFMQKYMWQSGTRFITGSSNIPSMGGRAIGGSTLINSAIMLPLPEYVRYEWYSEKGLSFLAGSALDESYQRIFQTLNVSTTKKAALGKANLVAKRVFENANIHSAALPRAIKNCEGAGDCVIGCPSGKKQSVDRNYIPMASQEGAHIFSCSQVDKIIHKKGRVSEVRGWVVEPTTRKKSASFRVKANYIIMAAGAANTPGILLKSGLHGNKKVGKTFAAHLSGGVAGIMPEKTNPWVGATQGWGAMPHDMPGFKFETLWTSESLLSTRIEGHGDEYMKALASMAYSSLIVVNYRASLKGRVRNNLLGMPVMQLKIPQFHVRELLKALKIVADGFLKTGAQYVSINSPKLPDKLFNKQDTALLLTEKIEAADLKMSGNHIFSSCPMGPTEQQPVDLTGKLRGTENVYICDASIFPNASGANPQATVMALSDLITRRLCGNEDYLDLYKRV